MKHARDLKYVLTIPGDALEITHSMKEVYARDTSKTG